MVSAGEALNPEVIAAWREATGLEICDGYGQTETGHLTGNLDGEPVRPGSMGRALPGLELRVAEGELQVRVASCPTFFSPATSRATRSTASGGRPATSSARTTTAISGTRAATTT